MTPREIIAEAWAITTKEASIRRWAFTSSFLETLLSVKLLSYQVYFVYEHLYRGGEAGFFDIELLLYNALPLWAFITIITIFILMVVIELFMPHLCLGAIIGLAAKSYKKEEMTGGLVMGLYNFFPIFAIHEFLILSSLSTAITAISLIIRYIDPVLRWPSIGMVIFLFLFANVLKFTFSFAEEGVVIRKQGIFEAIGKSFKLIVSHLGHIMFLLILLFVISLRIIFNVAVIVVVPAIVIGIAFLLTRFLPDVWSYSISAVIGVILIVVASYFFAYLHAFKQTVWTLTYMELSSRKELDVIE